MIRKSTKVSRPEKFELRREHVEIERREDGTILGENDAKIVADTPEKLPTATHPAAPVPERPSRQTRSGSSPEKVLDQGDNSIPPVKKAVKHPPRRRRPGKRAGDPPSAEVLRMVADWAGRARRLALRDAL